jgi:hypothetical protein
MNTLTTRVALWIVAAEAALVAVPASITPRYFYDSFPLGLSWVDKLPPYNEHLVSDVGGFYIAFALLFAWAATTLRRSLIVPLCVAYTIAAIVHFVYHVTHLDGFDTADVIAQTISLALVVALPILAAVAAPREPREEHARRWPKST